MMGGGLIVGGAVVAVVFVISLDRRVRNAFQGRMNPRAYDEEHQQPTTGYQPLAPLIKRHQRRVRFAKKNVEYPPPPLTPPRAPPAPWRSTFYEPARQRFETVIVDGVYVRHSISSSGNSIAET